MQDGVYRMIQFNLLPDLKLEYIKTQSSKRKMYTIAVLVLIGSAVVIVLLFGALGVQKSRIALANNKIEENSKKLESIKDLDKILTVQNQLETLKELHAKKTASSRLFNYLPQLTPTNASIGQLTIDFPNTTLKISGTADSLETVNKFADTIKAATYTSDGSEESKTAFKSVVLENVGRDSKGASYTLLVEFEPVLFDGQSKVILKVPQLTSTRSFTESTTNSLFNGSVAPQKEDQ